MRLAGLIAVLFATAAAPASPLSFKVIVREDCPASEISREDLSNIFLKLLTKWPSGEGIHPVEPAATSDRLDFARVVHQRSLGAIRAYWLQQIYSGRDVPPTERRSDAEIVEYVRTTPGAIGYVSDQTPVQGVKVLALRGLPATPP